MKATMIIVETAAKSRHGEKNHNQISHRQINRNYIDLENITDIHVLSTYLVKQNMIGIESLKFINTVDVEVKECN